MKIKIDVAGNLFFERANGKLQSQFCPFTTETSTCGDWCPHFMTGISESSDIRILWLCHGKNYTSSIEDFIDERQNNANSSQEE